MISDFSGVMMDYAFIFNKPIMYANADIDLMPYDADWLDEQPWLLKTLEQIGKPVKEEDFPHMKELIDELLSENVKNQQIQTIRSEAWQQQGKAAQNIVDFLIEKTNQLEAELDDANINNNENSEKPESSKKSSFFRKLKTHKDSKPNKTIKDSKQSTTSNTSQEA